MAVKDRSSLQNGFDAVGAIETNTSNLVTAARIVTQLDNISDSSVSRLDDPYPRFAGSVSGTNAIAITITNDYPSAYASAGNTPVLFIPANANTGSPTININALGALNVYKLDQTQITAANSFLTTLSYQIRWSTDADGAGTDGFVLIGVFSSGGGASTDGNDDEIPYLSSGNFIYNSGFKFDGTTFTIGDFKISGDDMMTSSAETIFQINGGDSSGTPHGAVIQVFDKDNGSNPDDIKLFGGTTTPGKVYIENTDLLPGVDESYDLGSTSLSWQDLFAKRISFDDGSNYLDDYEEGTATITMRDATSGGNTGSTATSYYTKIGDIVNLQVEFTNMSTVGMTGANVLYFTGFPFAGNSNVDAVGTIQADSLNVDASKLYMNFLIQKGNNYGFIVENADNVAVNAVIVSQINSGTTDIVIQITYKI